MATGNDAQEKKTPVNGTSRFYVLINDKETAVFTEVGALQIETEVFEYKEGGLNDFIRRMPGRSKVGNITLKHGMAGDSKLFHWYMDILKGNIKKQNVTIQSFGVDGQLYRSWALFEAFPVKWVGPQLSAGANSLAIETLELAHNGFDLLSKQ